MRLAHSIAYLVVRLVTMVLQALSIETCERITRWLAWLLADVFRVRRAVVDANLRLAFPDWTDQRRDQVVRAMWEHLLLMLVEIAHAPRKIHETNWRDYLHLRDGRTTVDLILSERPSIFVAAHYGNFELAGYVTGLLGVATHTVARALDNPYLHDWVNRFRATYGQQMVAKKGGSDELMRVLGAGGNLVFLADQYAGSKGCWVEFFGHPASAHKAIALLALEGQARVAVYYSRRLGRALHYEAGVQAVYDPTSEGARLDTVSDITQWYTGELEQIIRRQPEQYWWLHRRWKDNRPARRRKRLAA